MKGYFGGKEILQVVLGGKTLYKKSSEVEELPPPETLTVRVNAFIKGFLSYDTVPPTESYGYNLYARMTDWIEVRPNSSYEIRTYMSNRCVIQLKNSDGEITALTEFKDVSSVQGVVFSTGDNIYVRVHFYQATNPNLLRDLFFIEQRD